MAYNEANTHSPPHSDSLPRHAYTRSHPPRRDSTASRPSLTLIGRSLNPELPIDSESEKPQRSQTRYLMNYQLPPLVHALQENWTTSLRSGMILSSILFLGSILLLLFNDQTQTLVTPTVSRRTTTAFLSLIYVTIILQLNATICAFFLIDQVNELYLYSASALSHGASSEAPTSPTSTSSPNPAHHGTDAGWIIANTSTILRHYGMKRSWELGVWHWFLSLMLGTLTFVASILLFLWTVHGAMVTLNQSGTGTSVVPVLVSCIVGCCFVLHTAGIILSRST